MTLQGSIWDIGVTARTLCWSIKRGWGGFVHMGKRSGEEAVGRVFFIVGHKLVDQPQYFSFLAVGNSVTTDVPIHILSSEQRYLIKKKIPF